MSLFEEGRPKETFTTKDALEYSHRLAEAEIKRIEQLHTDYKWFVSGVGGLFGLLLAVFGIIGWNNLRDQAVRIAQRTVQDEVKVQVEQKLTAQRIEEVVNDVVTKKAQQSIDKRVRDDIDAGLNRIITERIGPIVATEVQKQRQAIEAQIRRDLAIGKVSPQISVPFSSMNTPPTMQPASGTPATFGPNTIAASRFSNARVFLKVEHPRVAVRCDSFTFEAGSLLMNTFIAADWIVEPSSSCAGASHGFQQVAVVLHWPRAILRKDPNPLALHTPEGEMSIGIREALQVNPSITDVGAQETTFLIELSRANNSRPTNF